MSEAKKELLRTVKFALFSISAAAIQALVSWVLALLGITDWVCYLGGLVMSVVWNFTLNRKFTFQSATNVPIAMVKVAAFYAVFTPLSTWWVAALTEPPVDWELLWVEGGTMLVNFVLEFLYQRFFVFGKSIDTAKKD